MSSRKASVLVVDDDAHMLLMMQRVLELEGYRVLKVSNGEAAIDMLVEETPELVLLDIMMPTVDGYNVCRQIREFSQIPIIMVTAKGSDEEKVEGFDAGADDYVTKPFSAEELTARVRAVLRRTKLGDERSESPFQSDALVIDFAQHRVTLSGQEVNLTATEYRLVSYLARNAGQVLTSAQILEKVWGEDYFGEIHVLQVNMARIRKKMGDDPKAPRFITTRTGIGYMFLKPH